MPGPRLNGDRTDDLILGALGRDNGGTDAGEPHILNGLHNLVAADFVL